MVKEILERLQRLKTDVINSPEFDNVATAKVKNIVDSVLDIFLKVNGNVHTGFGKVGNNIFNNLGLNSAPIKSKFSILSNLEVIKNKININRELSPSAKQIALNKLELIRRIQ